MPVIVSKVTDASLYAYVAISTKKNVSCVFSYLKDIVSMHIKCFFGCWVFFFGGERGFVYVC